MSMDPEFFTITQLKEVGVWPLSFLPAYGIIPYLKRLKVSPIQGLEVGVLKGENAYVMLEQCPTLKLTGIDFYQEHHDGDHVRTQADMDRYQEIARENLAAFTGRYNLIQKNSLEYQPEPETYDFILLDTVQTKDQVKRELEIYYPALKPNGYMFVHDVQMKDVLLAIKEFRNENKYRNPLYTNGKNFVGFWQK